MRRCCLLLILISTAALLDSCASCTFYSHNASDSENCNMNPSLAHEWPSLDGKRKLVEERFVCPGWYSLNLDVHNADSTKAIVFTARPAAQTRPPVWPELKVEWKSDRELWITYPAGQDTTCISNAGDVIVHCIDAAVTR